MFPRAHMIIWGPVSGTGGCA